MSIYFVNRPAVRDPLDRTSGTRTEGGDVRIMAITRLLDESKA